MFSLTNEVNSEINSIAVSYSFTLTYLENIFYNLRKVGSFMVVSHVAAQPSRLLMWSFSIRMTEFCKYDTMQIHSLDS